MTSALVQRGLGGYIRDENEPVSAIRSDSPKSIESGSGDSGLNEDNNIKNWETTEQRMNTDPPVSER